MMWIYISSYSWAQRINLELTMVNHDGDPGNTTSNVDLDMFVVDSQEKQ